MKRIITLFLSVLMVGGLIACSATTQQQIEATEEPVTADVTVTAVESLSGSFTYTYTGMMGEETMQIDFSDGMATMFLPNHAMIKDKYASAYTVDGDTVMIAGFKNVDAASQYAVPGLWDWIDATTGAAMIVLDKANGTFSTKGVEVAIPALTESSETQNVSGDPLSNIAYASNSPAQALDIVLPDGEGPFPLVILVHGGGFAFGDKQMSIVQNMFNLTNAGYAVATVNYRLSGEASYPAAIADVKAAVRFLRANAVTYALNPEQFAIWGESAGAYLAVMAAVTPDGSFQADVTDNATVSDAVSCVIDFYGPITFFQMDEDFAALGVQGNTGGADSFESKWLGLPVGELSDEMKAEMSPLTYISADTKLQAFIQAGSADANIPYTQSTRLADAFKEVIGDQNVKFEILDGAAHMDNAFYTADNLAKVVSFLNGVFQS